MFSGKIKVTEENLAGNFKLSWKSFSFFFNIPQRDFILCDNQN
jgi:hypothetical protein